ncbi:MAG TPA: hypothetical protein VIA18_15885 [Polyangia bacterium]|nr:hypothetical protein [Polyangia bacterium]
MLALNFVPEEMLAGGIHVNPVVAGFLYFVAGMAVLIFISALVIATRIKD